MSGLLRSSNEYNLDAEFKLSSNPKKIIVGGRDSPTKVQIVEVKSFKIEQIIEPVCQSKLISPIPIRTSGILTNEFEKFNCSEEDYDKLKKIANLKMSNISSNLKTSNSSTNLKTSNSSTNLKMSNESFNDETNSVNSLLNSRNLRLKDRLPEYDGIEEGERVLTKEESRLAQVSLRRRLIKEKVNILAAEMISVEFLESKMRLDFPAISILEMENRITLLSDLRIGTTVIPRHLNRR